VNKLHDATIRLFEDNLLTGDVNDIVLALYVAGASDLSVRAINHVHALCESQLSGHLRLEVVDVHRAVAATKLHNVLATAAVIKEYPAPERRVVGDLSNSALVLATLHLPNLDVPVGGRS